MKKLFMVIPLLGYSLTYPDFSLCYKKYKNYSIIPISKYYSITAKRPKHYNYVKYDKKYKLYLIKKYNKYYMHFKNAKLGTWLASIKKGKIYSGNYAEYPKNNTPAKFSTKTTPGSIMTDIFCNPIGIGVNGGFLTLSGIKKFVIDRDNTPILLKNKYHKQKINRYIFKFLGIIVNKNLVVTKIFPNSWASKHYIPKYSKIIKINNKRVYSLKDIKFIPKSGKITFYIKTCGNWSSYYKR